MALTPDQIAKLFEYNENNRRVELRSFTIDGNEIEAYADYSYFEAKSYVTSPERTADGSMPSLNSLATFLTPRLRIKFDLMPIETYRTIMKLIQQKNEFSVTCYDVVWDKMVTKKMYFQPEDFPELFIYDLQILGAIGYEIELTGTNNDEKEIDVVYHLNPPAELGLSDQTEGSNAFPEGSTIVVGADSSFDEITLGNGKYSFSHWNTAKDNSGFTYVNNEDYTIYNSLVLYSIWQGQPLSSPILSNPLTIFYEEGLVAYVDFDINNPNEVPVVATVSLLYNGKKFHEEKININANTTETDFSIDVQSYSEIIATARLLEAKVSFKTISGRVSEESSLEGF